MAYNGSVVIVGYVVGMFFGIALTMLNVLVLFPMLMTWELNDPGFNAYIAGLPRTNFILFLLAYLGPPFVGAWIAARLGKSHQMKLAMGVGFMWLTASVMTMSMAHGPTPAWLVIMLPLPLVVAWAAGRPVTAALER